LIDLIGLYIYAYLIGSVPTAYIIGRMVKGVDIRETGSGNVGASNLYQIAGRRWLAPLGIFELLIKAGSPIWIGQYLMGLDRLSLALIAAPLLTIAGNNWSIFLRFQGGRGVAVVFGTLLALSPLLVAAFAAVALAGWAVTRSAGVWVLIALALLPLWSTISGGPAALTVYCACLVALIVLKRLLANHTGFPEGISRKKVLFNRLFLDRDVDDRADWVKRIKDRAN
jgi:glycerol-3-phosphate acyltransferase PlsY